MKSSHILGLTLAAAVIAAPAFAQNTAAPGTGTTSTMGTTSATPNAAPGAGSTTGGMGAATGMASSSTHNPVLADNGDVRSSQVVGSSVYNDKNEKLGSVDDILLNKDGKADQAVISVGGVLGVGAKLVAVPYDKLKFADTVDNNTARVMMPGTNADALNGMPTFHYASK